MKSHLHNSDDPAREGDTLKAVCGSDVPKAAFVFFFDAGSKLGAEFFLTLNRINTCANCLEGEFKQRYIYGIRTGQEARDEAA